MALPDSTMKITLQLSSPQKFKFYNVFYYKATGVPTWGTSPMADAHEIGSGIFGGNIIANLPASLTQNTSIVGGAYELHKDGQVYETSDVTGDPGTIDDDECDDVIAVVMQKRTGTAGKSGRGRWFLGPVPESLTDENFLTEAGHDQFTTIMTDWTTVTGALLGTTWKPCLWSPKTNTLVEVTSGYVDYKLGRISGRKSRSILT